jgi:hypothetical protein
MCLTRARRSLLASIRQQRSKNVAEFNGLGLSLGTLARLSRAQAHEERHAEQGNDEAAPTRLTA